MTSNNLKEHISWFLDAKPFIPPATACPQPPLEDIPTSSTTLTAEDLVFEPEDLRGNVRELGIKESVAIGSVAGAGTVKRPPLPATDSLQAQSDPRAGAEDMAKLRSAPSSVAKPRLLAQTSTKTPIQTALNGKYGRDPAVTPFRREPGNVDQCLPAHPIPQSPCRADHANGNIQNAGRAPETPLLQMPDWGFNAIDLTEDSQERSVPNDPQQSSLQAGRKRKSEEFFSDMPRKARPCRSREVSASPSDTEFAPIEDSMDDPPPPYSTVAPANANLPTAQSSTKRPAHEHAPFDEGFDEEEYSVTEMSIRTETRKRKSLSRTLSDCTSRPSRFLRQSPPEVDKSEASRVPSSLRSGSANPKRRIVADSEDDEEPATLEAQEDSKVNLHGGLQNNLTAKGQEDNQQRSVAESHIRPTVQEKMRSNGFDDNMRSVPDSVSNRSLPSPFQRDSPTKKEPVPSSFDTDTQQPSSTDAAPEDKAVVQDFLGWADEVVRQKHEEICKQLRSKSEATYQYIDEDQQAPPDLLEEIKVCHRKKKAMEDLMKVRDRHLQTSKRKQALKRRVIEALEEGLDPAAYQADIDENKAVTQTLRNLELDIIRLLRGAGLLIGSGSSVRLQSTQAPERDVVIRSTQVTPTLELAAIGSIPDSSAIPRTQFVQQTQVASEGLTTPSKPSRKLVPSRSLADAYNKSTAAQAPDIQELSATDVGTYFSPSKRKPKSVVFTRSPERDFTYENYNSSIRQQGDSTKKPSKGVNHAVTVPQNEHGVLIDDALDEDDFEEDEALFSTVMGTPPARVGEDDEEAYGDFDDDDEEMLEATESFENPPGNRPARFDQDRGPRNVFAETSGNHGVRPSGTEYPLEFLAKKATKAPTAAPPAAMMQHRWSRDVKAVLKDRFHLRGFRPNQLEAINATLAGKDAFVLMPTGGGKSLCYQLPSIINSGKTRGVTVVISPLLSLMEDQVEHLKALHIQAFLINSECSTEQRRQIMQALRDPKVEEFIQLLYVTPEMLSKSQAIINAFKQLHAKDRLARIVIDEAHCVSQWGHDFRPDYKALGEVRQQFLGVPVMALTATATENVKVDVIHNLNINGCEVFTQSFNRPNLTYEVRTKGKPKDVLDSIANTINTSYRGQSGIVYCLSRAKCEDIAEKLRKEYGIKAHHYHAGMDPADKSMVQRQWQAGRYHVIVATIAFGMGIDKADVRFVIHHSIPKSLEGYYQETGRAGRDGKRSGCYLYYGYQDTSALRRMIDDSDGSWEQKERQYQMLRNVVQFCENRTDCRRVQVLAYFSEHFRREDCNGACDNCTSTSTFESRDFTDYAASAISLVKQLQHENVTLLHCVDVFRGGKSKKIVDSNHMRIKEYGVGADLDRGDVERLFYRLLSEDALTERNVVNKAGFASQYIHLGRNCNEFKNGRRRLKIQVRISPNGKAKKTKTAPKIATKKQGTGVGATRQDYPLSTNVSSPIQAASRRRVARYNDQEDDSELHPNGYYRDSFVVADNDFDADYDDGDDDFEPVRIAGVRSSKPAKRELGPPITVDEKMNSLNPTHRMVVEDFMQHAKQECQKIMISKSLRAVPFTDTMLREMAINFPKDEQELLQIEGVDPEKVQLYGKKFLRLIGNAQNFYESVVKADEDRPRDPNHENVIDLVSDDEEDEYGGDFDFDEEDSSQEEQSTYFKGPSAEVAAFNAQYSASQAPSRAMPPPAAKTSSSRGGGYGASKSRGSRGGFSRGGRRPSAGTRGRSSGGIAKRGATRKRDGGNRTFSNGTSRGFGGGGIGMMPI